MTMTEKIHSIQNPGETMTEAVHRVQKPGQTMTEAIAEIGGSTTPPAAPVPGKPTGLTVVGTTTEEIEISWDAMANAANYVVSVAGVPGYPDSIATTSTKIKSLVPDTSYTIKIKACNADGKCSAEAQKTVKTAAQAATTGGSTGGTTGTATKP